MEESVRLSKLAKDSVRFATVFTPWFLVVFGLLGKVDFSQPTEVVRTGLIAWVTAALVSIPFAIGLHAVQRALTRRKEDQKCDKSV